MNREDYLKMTIEELSYKVGLEKQAALMYEENYQTTKRKLEALSRELEEYQKKNAAVFSDDKKIISDK